jgi:two-component system chemotaxis response regulator CheV
MSKKQDILLEIGTNEVEIAEFGIFHENGIDFQSFGINVAKVREIIKTPDYMKIPNTHKDVLGVFKLREKIIPLIDLGNWLNYKPGDGLEDTYVIVTEFSQDNFGFLVHKIETIHRMSWEKVLPPIEAQSSITKNCITGMVDLATDNKKKVMFMIDFEKIVTDINPEASLSIETDKNIIEKLKTDIKNPKVLLAEDSGIIRDLIKGILDKGGFEVISVNNGKRAWDHIKEWKAEAIEKNVEINDIIQFVITDIEMPQMDGHSLLRKIKEDSELKTLPVILFSSLIYEEIRRKGDLIGADAQISKPEIGNLLKIVDDVLKKNNE